MKKVEISGYSQPALDALKVELKAQGAEFTSDNHSVSFEYYEPSDIFDMGYATGREVFKEQPQEMIFDNEDIATLKAALDKASEITRLKVEGVTYDKYSANHTKVIVAPTQIGFMFTWFMVYGKMIATKEKV